MRPPEIFRLIAVCFLKLLTKKGEKVKKGKSEKVFVVLSRLDNYCFSVS
jgi:hypothetical protein